MPTWQTLPYGATRYKIPGMDSGFIGEDPRCPKKWYDRYRQYYRAYTWSIRDTGVYDHYLYYFCQDGAIQCAEGNEWVQVLQQCAPKCAQGAVRNAEGACETQCPEDKYWDTTTLQCLPRCVAPEKWNTKTKQCEVECTVPDIEPYEPDPYPLNLKNLTPRMKEGVDCLTKCTGQPASALLDSAYRPYPYQKHLRDVYKKWNDELKNNTQPECAARKAKIKNDYDAHGLDGSKQAPSADPNNCHSNYANTNLANCVDIHKVYIEAVDFCSNYCEVYRSWPSGPRKDPIHVVPY